MKNAGEWYFAETMEGNVGRKCYWAEKQNAKCFSLRWQKIQKFWETPGKPMMRERAEIADRSHCTKTIQKWQSENNVKYFLWRVFEAFWSKDVWLSTGRTPKVMLGTTAKVRG